MLFVIGTQLKSLQLYKTIRGKMNLGSLFKRGKTHLTLGGQVRNPNQVKDDLYAKSSQCNPGAQEAEDKGAKEAEARFADGEEKCSSGPAGHSL